jgi:predicted nucleotidyltransferase
MAYQIDNEGRGMTRSELLEKLSNVKDELRQRFGIEEIALFGSYSRNEADEESDIDIAVISMKEKNYFTLIDAMKYLEEKLQRKVDMGFFDSMRPFIKRRIKDDMIHV